MMGIMGNTGTGTRQGLKLWWIQYDPTLKESESMFYSKLCFIVCEFIFSPGAVKHRQLLPNVSSQKHVFRTFPTKSVQNYFHKNMFMIYDSNLR